MKKEIVYLLTGLLVFYGVLMIPLDTSPEIQNSSNETPFVWDQDERWEQLELNFNTAKTDQTISVSDSIESGFIMIDQLIEELSEESFDPTDPRLNALLNQFFKVAPFIAAEDNGQDELTRLYNEGRKVIKEESVHWNIENRKSRITLYKTLYGMRAAVEEVLLQSENEIDPVLHVQDEPSSTPSTEILGIKVHSGDMLVSRGGAEVSALISRGNDFPGNFSHVALIYVDEETSTPYLIEAHIERGVDIATAEEYINDRKLRFMVLRPRQDLAQLKVDPMLPHKAANYMYNEARKRHIPYDFKMNFYDPEKMFCSEVGSYAYKEFGVQLWPAESTISSDGVVKVMNTFGVENFVTQMPSDLEYDPQLSVVGEWRDMNALFEDHLYNSVIDAMLVCAENGEDIDYNSWMLPVIRVVKVYSKMLNWMGMVGPVPEGMSALEAAKSDAFINRHESLKQEVREKSERFRQENGYIPPYWELVRIAENTTGCTEI
ncbi:MAG: YiiX/YebB-like N1pC/P60 family cysteine hydrolase [Gracilimonas sp.]|nr:YiiX/YebB-like N1pC/P60 family cysteine hydrolase [Gracilimonas sp.]